MQYKQHAPWCLPVLLLLVISLVRDQRKALLTLPLLFFLLVSHANVSIHNPFTLILILLLQTSMLGSKSYKPIYVFSFSK